MPGPTHDPEPPLPPPSSSHTNIQILPRLVQTRTSAQLIVHSKPHLILGGELQNSSFSDPTYMRTILPRLKAMNLNTILGSVTWEMIEPVENHFDFERLDEVLLDVRRAGMKVVLLWFGAFKNATSTYVPGWVKRDGRRFPRVKVKGGGGGAGGKEGVKTIELLSPWSTGAMEADAKAFGRLMAHLKDVDGVENTVVMVQVENEPGMLGDCRDRSRVAEVEWRKSVPSRVVQALSGEEVHKKFRRRFPRFGERVKEGMDWVEAFGSEQAAGEFFMADVFSRYVQFVGEAGKKEYPIPLFANVWMNADDTEEGGGEAAGGSLPGEYPSGGAVAHVMDIWKHNAPVLDFISPDVYTIDYEAACKDYRHRNQPLFIPEQRRDEYGARRVFCAYGTHLAIGCSPFGIDTLDAATSPISRYYGLLASLSEIILETQANRPEDIMGIFFDEKDDKADPEYVRRFGEIEVSIERATVYGKPGPGSGLIIHKGDGVFLLAGWGFQLSFHNINPKATFTGIQHAEEKTATADGKLLTARWLNGDETRSGKSIVMPNEDPDYGDFPVAITIPGRTGLAEIVVYTLFEDQDDL